LPTPAPQPQPLPNIDPTQLNYAVSIVADTYGPDTVTGGLIGTSARVWRFFPTYYQKAVGCQPRDVDVVQKIVPKVDGKPYHVDGTTVPLDLFGKFCEYKNSGGTSGTLWCGKTGIKCKEDDHTTKDCGTDTDKFSRQTVFVCDIKNLDFTKRDAPEMTKIPTPPSQPTNVVKRAPAKTLAISGSPATRTALPARVNPSPNQPNYALSIVVDTYNAYVGQSINNIPRYWYFFDTYYRDSVGCRDPLHAANKVVVHNKDDNPYYFANDIPVTLFGQDCHYMNRGNTLGSLWCGTEEYQCKEDSHKKIDCPELGGTRETVFVCEFGKTKPAKREAPTTTLISLPQSAKVTKREESKPYWSSSSDFVMTGTRTKAPGKVSDAEYKPDASNYALTIVANTATTVQANEPQFVGWDIFDSLFGQSVEDRTDPVVFTSRALDANNRGFYQVDTPDFFVFGGQRVSYHNNGKDAGEVHVNGVTHRCRKDWRFEAKPVVEYKVADMTRLVVYTCDWN
jgi:hypothetical protein